MERREKTALLYISDTVFKEQWFPNKYSYMTAFLWLYKYIQFLVKLSFALWQILDMETYFLCYLQKKKKNTKYQISWKLKQQIDLGWKDSICQ